MRYLTLAVLFALAASIVTSSTHPALNADELYVAYLVRLDSGNDSVVGIVKFAVSDEGGRLIVHDPRIVEILDYNISNTSLTPEEYLTAFVRKVSTYMLFYNPMSTPCEKEFQTPEGLEMRIRCEYSGETHLMLMAYISMEDPENREPAYAIFMIRDTNVPGGTAPGTTHSEQSSISPRVREGDWVKYRIIINKRYGDEYLRATATVTVVFHVRDDIVTTEADTIEVDDLETNIAGYTVNKLKQELSLMVTNGRIPFYRNPSSLPPEGSLSGYSGSLEVVAEYDTVTGVLKSASADIPPPGNGTIRIELLESSIPGITNAGLRWSMGNAPTLIGVLVGAALTAAVVWAIMFRKAGQPNQ